MSLHKEKDVQEWKAGRDALDPSNREANRSKKMFDIAFNNICEKRLRVNLSKIGLGEYVYALRGDVLVEREHEDTLANESAFYFFAEVHRGVDENGKSIKVGERPIAHSSREDFKKYMQDQDEFKQFTSADLIDFCIDINSQLIRLTMGSEVIASAEKSHPRNRADEMDKTAYSKRTTMMP